MTGVVEEATSGSAGAGVGEGGLSAQELLAQVLDDKTMAALAARARESGLALLGEGVLMQQLVKRLVEASLEGEMDAHLGYAKHDPAGRRGGNWRNGRRAKTVATAVGPVQIEVPRDRDGSFQPQIVHKRQRVLSGGDGITGIVLSLSAKGLTTGQIAAHLAKACAAPACRRRRSWPSPTGCWSRRRRLAVPAAGPGLPGDLHRRDPGQDP